MKKKRIHKSLALIAGFTMLLQTCWPTAAWALSSGPSQPEFSSFESIANTQMVDLFTGDFTYNLPLLAVPGTRGGYPLNLFYKSVTNMEEEASMVGLGWNIGVGAINRSLRGIPDDFSGEKMTHIQHRKPNITGSVGLLVGVEVLPFDSDKKVSNSDNADLASLTLDLSLEAMYSNYKGPGFKSGFSAGLNFGKNRAMSAGFSSSFSSFEGVNYSPSIGMSYQFEQDNKTYKKGPGLSWDFNTLSGLKSVNVKGLTSPFHLNDPTFLPNVTTPTISVGTSGKFKVGFEIYTVLAYGGASGSIFVEKLRDNGKTKKTSLYGTMYLADGKDKFNAALDFSRDHEKPLFKNLKSLPVPISDEDYFSVSGQGMNGSFKIFRSDIGIYRDKIYHAGSGDGSFGGELGVSGLARFGADIKVSYIENYNDTKNWINTEGSNLNFRDKERNSTNEPFYFDFLYSKSGHSTSPYAASFNRSYAKFGNDEPVRLKLNGSSNSPEISSNLMTKSGSSINYFDGLINGRKARGTSIQYFTNNDIVKSGGASSILQEFNIDYHYAHNGDDLANIEKKTYTRPENDQLAGFVMLDEQGSRWNYAMPVMNEIQRDVAFSYKTVDEQNTCTKIVDDFINDESDGCNARSINYDYNGENEELYDFKEIPAYASSFQLTSQVGHDYIDQNSKDGPPNHTDYGHWVRFEYLMTHKSGENGDALFKWRQPFSGAYFNSGQTSNKDDNKAFFSYGEREQSYPYRIYTNTHFAEFTYSQRRDNRGANCWLQSNMTSGSLQEASSLKLESIKLFRYDENKTNHIKTIEFTYENSLCPDVPNNASTGAIFSGKLTLKSVSTINYESTRGKETPYEFEYYNEGANSPAYSQFNSDRWGVYQPTVDDECENVKAPYTRQSHADGPEALESYHKDAISAWHLKKITLPSGSEINIDVGRDHYAHVQNSRAAQMFQITGFGTATTNQDIQDIPISKWGGDQKDFRVHFKLNDPIPNSDMPAANALLAEHFEDLYEEEALMKQIPFNLFTDLVGSGNHFESVEGLGYLLDGAFGFDPANGDGNFVSAWFVMQAEEELIRGDRYHPMLVAAWQYLKINRRELLLPYSSAATGNSKDVFDKIAAIVPDILTQFKSFYKRAINDGYGQKVDVSKSFVRLANPTKKKYGGNARVNKVFISNIWNKEPSPYYGNVYLYEKTEEFNGESRQVSTGVACNEPFVGGIETAFKHHERYTQQLKNASDDIYFDVYPLNETHMQPPDVGYSEVIVRSLASEYHNQKFETDGAELPANFIAPGQDPDLDAAGIASTGQTIYKFYTAKDYPIVFDQTRIEEKTASPANKFSAFIGGFSEDTYAATQGYSVELNDMHGKPESVEHFGQNKNGDFSVGLVTGTKYFYHDKMESYHEGARLKQRRRLVNDVDILVRHDGYFNPGKAEVVSGQLGVDRELYLDFRRVGHESYSVGVGGQIHAFLAAIWPVVFPTALPSIDGYKSILQTAVSNKVIRRAGIIKRIETQDGQARSNADNLLFDPYTGQALLQKVTNIYEDEQFKYIIPQREYQYRMGSAAQNWGACFEHSHPIVPADQYTTFEINACNNYLNTNIFGGLTVGDEIICRRIEDNEIFKLTYLYGIFPIQRSSTPNQDYGQYFHVYPDASNLIKDDGEYTYEFKISRSGRRNQMNLPALEITTLDDPLDLTNNITVDLNYDFCSENSTFQVPTEQFVNVIDATAYGYEEFWHYAESPYSSNDYSIGNLGIFRLKNIQKPVGIRKDGTATLNERGTIDFLPKIKPNFSYPGGPGFSIDRPNDFTVPFGDQWIIDTEITQYAHDGNVIEQVDRLGNYSSILLQPTWFRSALVINHPLGIPYAHVQNSKLVEMAVADFDSYKSDGAAAAPATHFDVSVGSSSQRYLGQSYDIPFYGNIDANCNMIVKKEYNHTNNYKAYFKYLLPSTQPIIRRNPTTVSEINCDGWSILNAGTCIEPCHDGLQLTPTRVVLRKQAENVENITLTLTSIITINRDSRSGRIGMKPVYKGAEQNTIPFTTLDMRPGRKYYASFYAKPVYLVPNIDDFNARILDQGTTDPLFAQFQRTGKTPDGWIRFEVTFDAISRPYAIELDGELDQVIIDDLRIHPAAANMTHTIYDIDRLRPIEVLDENNYRTIYKYDSDGNLMAINKETEEGVYTIQEQIKYIVDP